MKAKFAQIVAAVALTALAAFTGCVSRCGGDPIVNPGVDHDGANTGGGYTPWWVFDLFPNGSGDVAK